MTFERVQAVEPLPGLALKVSFRNGAVKRYDVALLLNVWEPFQALSQVQGLFDQVRVDAGGYGISWNGDIDLSCNELWDNGTAWHE